LQQDAVLRDGDTLIVPRAVSLTSEEAAQLAVANFSPDFITVNVIGEVGQPGPVEVQPNTTLNQAILAAGGFDDPRALRGHVELLRLNSDGTISKRSVSVDFEDDLNEETNPPMRNNDVIIVRRNALSSTADLLQLITGPVGDIFTILGIFGEIDEVFEDIDDLFN
jgi:polysaccharide export outer membrane protein